MTKLGQDPAFVTQPTSINGYAQQSYPGMSKRLYVATAAVQGMLSNPAFSGIKSKPEELAKMAFGMSDELLKQEHKD